MRERPLYIITKSGKCPEPYFVRTMLESLVKTDCIIREVIYGKSLNQNLTLLRELIDNRDAIVIAWDEVMFNAEFEDGNSEIIIFSEEYEKTVLTDWLFQSSDEDDTYENCMRIKKLIMDSNK